MSTGPVIEPVLNAGRWGLARSRVEQSREGQPHSLHAIVRIHLMVQNYNLRSPYRIEIGLRRPVEKQVPGVESMRLLPSTTAGGRWLGGRR